MILEFTNLALTNFGSFLGKHELDLGSFGPGLHFIKGKNKEEPRLGANGVGKSQLWDSLCWCLYGKTPNGRRNPEIQPRFGDKHTSVTVKFSNNIITRTTFPNRLLLNQKEVGQEQIDAAVGLNFDTFTHTVLLGQGRPLFFDLPPKAKMDLFSAVLNLERWEERSNYAAEAARSLQTRLDTLVGELTGLEGRQNELERLLEAAKKNWATWRDARAEEALHAQERLAGLKTKRDRMEDQKAGFALAHDSAGTELKAIQKQLSDLAIEREKILEEKSKINAQLTIHKEKARSLRAELEALGKADVCPTCGQSLKGTSIEKHKAELKKSYKTVSSLLEESQDAWEAVTDVLATRDAELITTRTNQAKFAAKVEASRRDLDYIVPQIARLNAEITQLQELTKKKVDEANPYTEQVDTLRKKRKQLAAEYKEREERLQKLSAQIERTKFWIKGFREVRLYIIEDVLQELELTTNAALPEIGLVDWQVNYAIEKETKAGTVQRGLNVLIQSPKDKAPVKWECWSGGEGQRLRLVGALALSEVLLARASVEARMEILDEPTRGLSDEGVVDLCEYLADRAKHLDRQVWLTDHKAVESVRFTSVLTVTKDKKGSYLA